MNRFLLTSFLLILFAQLSTGTNLYTYVRRCRYGELCIQLKCSSHGQFGSFPYGQHYTCCQGKVIDETKHMCVKYSYTDGTSTTVALRCTYSNSFRCNDGGCTHKQWRCNNVKDCMDGSDETGCGPCYSWQFYCTKCRQCVSKSKVCDRKIDCGDGSDEIGCLRRSGIKCSSSKFRCNNDKCTYASWACDHYDDCGDNSDESGCQTSCTKKSSGKKRDEIPLKKEQNDGGAGKAVNAEKEPIV